MLQVTFDSQLDTINLFNLFNVKDPIAPHGFGTGVESPLHETREPEELFPVASEFALGLMSLPMLTLAILATVVGERRLIAIVVVNAADIASAALFREVATVRTLVV